MESSLPAEARQPHWLAATATRHRAGAARWAQPRVQAWRKRIAGGLGVLRIWVARSRQRRASMELDERLLRDIGVDRKTVREAYRKWFWQG
jgi:uncharacterized protein YjiS (DUF1127 family)